MIFMDCELIHIKENTYVLSAGDSYIGMYRFGKRSVVLIDTGRDEQEAVMEFLEKEDIRPLAIINTHLHIDHIGCNDLLKEKYQCDVYVSMEEIGHEIEAGYIERLEVTANPHEGKLDVSGYDFDIIPLPGHSHGHQGIATPDGVCFLGDAIMSEDVLNACRMPYHFDINAALDSMSKIKTLDYSVFVLSHRCICGREELTRAANANLKKEEHFREIINRLDSGRISSEKLAVLFMNEIGISKQKQDIEWVWDTAEARVKER